MAEIVNKLKRVRLFENAVWKGGNHHLIINITNRPIEYKYREGKCTTSQGVIIK